MYETEIEELLPTQSWKELTSSDAIYDEAKEQSNVFSIPTRENRE